jgi:predicted patatin/cPLA2 family phospholipase
VSFETMFELWLRQCASLVMQISKELKQYHDIEKLDDVRVIRDRQTSMSYKILNGGKTLMAIRGVPRLRVPKVP